MTSTELNHIEELISQAEDKINTNLKEAESICMHALAHCNKNTATPEILYKAGLILSQCGKINQAEKIWQDAIQVANTKNDDLYKAFILHNIGTIKADLGNVVEATYLWEESLSIKEKLNDKKGIAATLNNLAWVSKLELDNKEETRLLLKAIDIFVEFEMWTDIADNLIKLSISDEKNSLYYLTQAFYISTKYYVNPKDVLYVVTEIIRLIGISNQYAAIFA
ncbi:tetratricopeptide repeat protein, partial [bacterium]